MPTIESRSYHCSTANVRVILSRQTFADITGIGGERITQRDHDCSRADTWRRILNRDSSTGRICEANSLD